MLTTEKEVNNSESCLDSITNIHIYGSRCHVAFSWAVLFSLNTPKKKWQLWHYSKGNVE